MHDFEYGHDEDEVGADAADERTSDEEWEQALAVFDSLVLVSNRQPYRHTYTDDGLIAVDRPTGGLTAALDPVLDRVGGTWIAWGDGDADRSVTDDEDRVEVPPDDPSYTLERVWIDDDLADAYYSGYSNRVLWPISHGILDAAELRTGDYDGYREVNEVFVDRVVPHVTPETLVWLQDYHLALAPAMIADRVAPAATIGLFWHIPWPSPTDFARVPQARDLLEGLLGTDVLGFHVDAFADRFLSCVEYFLDGAYVDHDASSVMYDNSRTQVVALPLGVDAESHASQSRAVDETVHRTVEEELSLPETATLGLGVDRLDYTKGIRTRLEAVETFLERHPEWRESFTFVQTATPSRTNIPAYAAYGNAVRETADRVNDRFGTDGWDPVVYTESHLSRAQLCALYRRADLMLVTSRSDGMNLVAKEYLAASLDELGALCLSEQAGAHEELGDAAYSLDPEDSDGIAETIERVLEDSEDERRRRMRTLRERVFDRQIDWWMGRQFEVFATNRRQSSILSPGYPSERQ